jgi:hypothetical protein
MHAFLKMQLFTLNIEETRIYFLILRFSLETYILLIWILKDVLDLSSIMKPGADPGFQVRGARLKKLTRAEGGAKFVWVFRVKKTILRKKNHIFSNFKGRSPSGSTPGNHT